MTAQRSDLNGLIVVDKPGGWTSRDVVNKLVATLGRGLAAGHAGTLDPMATGVLVVCVGPATRLVEYVQRAHKVYEAEVRMGATSDTDDAEGCVIAHPGCAEPSRTDVEGALALQVGSIMQTPPAFSALHVGGRRAYEKARAGENFELAPRRVEVYAIELLEYAWPRLRLRIECGSGTYIRSIARDLGTALGCGGLLQRLRRVRIGQHTCEDAVDPSADRDALLRGLRPASEAVAALPRLVIDAHQQQRICNGRELALDSQGSTIGGDSEVALTDAQGTLIAIAYWDRERARLRPRKVFAKCQADTMD